MARDESTVTIEINLDSTSRQISDAMGTQISLKRLARAMSLMAVKASEVQIVFDRFAEALEKQAQQDALERQKALSAPLIDPSERVESVSLGRKIRIREGQNGRSTRRKIE